jgi:hypothetical protein
MIVASVFNSADAKRNAILNGIWFKIGYTAANTAADAKGTNADTAVQNKLRPLAINFYKYQLQYFPDSPIAQALKTTAIVREVEASVAAVLHRPDEKGAAVAGVHASPAGVNAAALAAAARPPAVAPPTPVVASAPVAIAPVIPAPGPPASAPPAQAPAPQ